MAITRGLRCAVAGLLVLVLAACSGSGSEGGAELAQLEAAHRAAVESARQCAADEGFNVTEIQEGPGGIGFLYGVYFPDGAPEGEADRFQEVYDACQLRYDVDATYTALFESHVPTGAARERLWQDYLSCLDSAGVTVTNLSLSMHPNEVVHYLVHESEGAFDPEGFSDPDNPVSEPINPQVHDLMWDCMGKYHYLIFPSNE